MPEQGLVPRGRAQEEEIMGILLSSALFAGMTTLEREKLLRYLVSSYFQPRPGHYCRAHLRQVQSVPEN